MLKTHWMWRVHIIITFFLEVYERAWNICRVPAEHPETVDRAPFERPWTGYGSVLIKGQYSLVHPDRLCQQELISRQSGPVWANNVR